jgi:anti-sigma-K factor RskA
VSELPIDPAERDALDALLGAFALDALDRDDRDRVERYLEQDAAARAEVDEMRETAASLALAPASIEAPPELWARIAREIESGPAATAPAGAPSAGPAGDELAARRGRRTPVVRWVLPAAAVAAAVIAVLAAQVVSLHHQLDGAHRASPGALAAAFDRATKVGGARELALAGGPGAPVARVVLLPDGTGYLRGDHLRPVGAAETYQLWALMGDARNPTVVSAGVLGAAPKAVAFRASGPVVGFAISVEHAGGAVRPTATPIAAARFA